MNISKPVLRSLGVVEVFLIIVLFFTSITNTKTKHLKQKNKIPEIEFLFAHGYGSGKHQITHFQKNNIIPNPHKGIAFDGPEVTGPDRYPSLSKTAMGQERDIEVITNALKNINKPVIGVGVSKGAATWINAAAVPENIGKIKALVLESPFADATDVIHKIFFLNYVPGGHYITNKLTNGFLGYYNPKGIQPINSIAKITNKRLPILLIHSQEDSLIDVDESRKLYATLLEHGFVHVHLVETISGRHANLSPKLSVQKMVNAFYKRYNIEHNAKLTENTHLYSFKTIE